MFYLLAAAGVLAVTGLLFRFSLPRAGKTRWFIDTIWEPYIGVSFALALITSLGLFVAGLIALFAGS